ncbi:MAG: helix-turn-helix transcriptional regulator [Saprospiraceae bacterium]|nr:helix-turn-helix transcriptional regulator [Saprospiraceae bacterium]
MAISTHELMVKNMVCGRCMHIIKRELDDHGIEVNEIELGRVMVSFDAGSTGYEEIAAILRRFDFELLTDRDQILVERIKTCLRTLLDQVQSGGPRDQLSQVLAKTLSMNYGQISRTFSKLEGITVERYFIRLKIERVKELIQYGELSFKEIAYDLGYASPQHLSGQFKQVTGMSMSKYQQLAGHDRLGRDKIM